MKNADTKNRHRFLSTALSRSSSVLHLYQNMHEDFHKFTVAVTHLSPLLSSASLREMVEVLGEWAEDMPLAVVRRALQILDMKVGRLQFELVLVFRQERP